MARTQPTIVLSKSHDIPFNKLILSQANVRRVKTGLSIEELAEDIARRGLLRSLLPGDSEDLWDALIALDADSRAALFAHCAALTVNAIHDPYSRSPRRLAHADRIAGAVSLDMAASWTPTVENYLGRVTKTRILEAVREAKGEAAAQLIDHLKKPEMAKEAERLLSGTGWLPEPLRLPEPEVPADAAGADAEESLPAFLDDEDAPAAPMADAAE